MRNKFVYYRLITIFVKIKNIKYEKEKQTHLIKR